MRRTRYLSILSFWGAIISTLGGHVISLKAETFTHVLTFPLDSNTLNIIRVRPLWDETVIHGDDILFTSKSSINWGTNVQFIRGNFLNPHTIRRLVFPNEIHKLTDLHWESHWTQQNFSFVLDTTLFKKESDNRYLPSAQRRGQCLVPVFDKTNNLPISVSWSDCGSVQAASWTYGRFTVRHPSLTQLCVSGSLKNPWCLSSDETAITFEHKYISVNVRNKKKGKLVTIYKVNPHTVFDFSSKFVAHWHVFANTGFCLGLYKDAPFELQTILLLPCNSDHSINTFTFLRREEEQGYQEAHWQKIAFLISRFDTVLGLFFLEEQCLTNEEPLRFEACRDQLNQLWFYDNRRKKLYNTRQNCLSRKENEISSAISLSLSQNCQQDNAYTEFFLVSKNNPKDPIDFQLRLKDPNPAHLDFVSTFDQKTSRIMGFVRNHQRKLMALDIVGDRWLKPRGEKSPRELAWTWSPKKQFIFLSPVQNLEAQNFYQKDNYSIHLDGLGCLGFKPIEELSDHDITNQSITELTIVQCNSNQASQKWLLIPEVKNQGNP